MIIVKGRELLIPRDDYNIGTNYDDNTENRQFSIPRITSGGTDLSNLTFNLDIRYYNDGIDTAVLEKEVSDNSIVLTWEIRNSNLQVPGAVIIQIRATDSSGTVKWSSYEGAVFVEDAINVPASYTGSLTELEQLEESVRGVLSSETSRVNAENARVAAETARVIAETERENAETAREEAFNEAQEERTALYNASEAEREESYSTAETSRNTAYANAEDARNAEFTEAEETRQSTFTEHIEQFEEDRAGLTELVNSAITASQNASASESNAKESEDNAKESELLAKQYAEDAGRFTPEGYQELVSDVSGIKIDLGSKTSASAVTGNDAFSKIATLKTLVDQATPSGYDELVEDVESLKTDKIDDPSTKSDGQVLTYDETAGAWVAEDAAAKGTVYLTQAEYDALTDEEKSDGTVYCISDSESDPFDVSASAIPYDNSTSGLASTDVQSAIDEVNSGLADINTDLSEKTTWKYVGTFTGSNTLSIPNGWKEALVYAKTSNVSQMGEIKILKDMIDKGLQFFSNCAWFGGTNDYASYRLYVTTTDSLSLNIAKVNGADRISDTSVYVYYK